MQEKPQSIWEVLIKLIGLQKNTAKLQSRDIMEGFKIYLKFLIDTFREHSSYNAFENDPEYERVFKNHLFGLPGPKHLTRKWPPAEIFFSKLFYGFTEISSSYDNLVDI